MDEILPRHGSAGGKARAQALSKEERSQIARRAASARWETKDHSEDRKRISITLPPKLHQSAKAEAERRGETISELMETALKKELSL